MESVQTVDVSWLHHSQKGMSLAQRFLSEPLFGPTAEFLRLLLPRVVFIPFLILIRLLFRSSFPYKVRVISPERQVYR